MPYVKALWQNHKEEEATWEGDNEMRIKYLHFLKVNVCN